MASLKACPSKHSFTCTQRVSLEPPLKGNIKNCDNVIETAFVHEPAYLDPLLFCFFVLCFICYRWDEMAHFIFRTKWSWHTWTRHTVYLSLEKSSFLCWKQIKLSAFTLKRSTQTKDWIFFATQKQLTLKTGQKVKRICLNVKKNIHLSGEAKEINTVM